MNKTLHTCFFVEQFVGGPAAFETFLKTYKTQVITHTALILKEPKIELLLALKHL